MNRKLLSLVALSALFTAVFLFNNDKTAEEESEELEAMKSLDYWLAPRAYPNNTIPDDKYFAAYEYSKNNLSSKGDNAVDSWNTIGPLNVGGRTISLKINPLNGNSILAGSASGGLWRSYSGGVGYFAWHYVPTGFPVLGVGAIAQSAADTNVIYIGTGEVYGYANSIGGVTVRETRGSYGIGILKSTNNGTSWVKSLDWTYNQRRGVEVIRINPLNPNTVWAGTTEGTYRSYNAGQSWIIVDTTIMVTDLQINRLDTNMIFIACGNLGSAGYGLYRSANSGSSWQKLTNGLPPFYNGKALLSVYNASPNVIFASIGEGFFNNSQTWLVKSTDNGINWSTVSTENYAAYQGWFSHFVAVNPVDSSKVLAGGVDLYKSTTGGTGLVKKSTWSSYFTGEVPIGGPEGPPFYSHADHHAVEAHPTNPNIVYFGNDGGVFRTTDGGETFEGCNGAYQTVQFYNGFSSAPLDSNFAIGGLQDNSTVIYDGDYGWIKALGGDGAWTAINHRNQDTVYSSYQFLNILRSEDSGTSFSTYTPPTGYNTSFVAPFILGKVNPQIVYAGRSVVFKSTDGGNSWELTNGGITLNGNNPVLCLASSKTSDNVVYATTSPVFSRAKIFVTANGGTSWTDITGTLPDRYMIDVTVDPVNDSIAYVVLSGFGTSHLYRTTNRGAGWTDINNNLPDVPTSSVIVDPDFPQHIYIGNDLGVFVSTNNGTVWQAFNAGLLDAALVMDLSISLSNRKLRAITHGNGAFERPLLGNTIGIQNISSTVNKFSLEQNYPNPFNPATKIKFSIPIQSNTKLVIYDITGREAAILINENLKQGIYAAEWNASSYASGIYFYVLQSENIRIAKKMILLK